MQPSQQGQGAGCYVQPAPHATQCRQSTWHTYNPTGLSAAKTPKCFAVLRSVTYASVTVHGLTLCKTEGAVGLLSVFLPSHGLMQSVSTDCVTSAQHGAMPCMISAGLQSSLMLHEGP